MTNVCFAGVTGWSAPPILAAISSSDDLSLVAGVSRSAAGRSLSEVTGLDVEGQVYGSVGEALSATTVDVVVDYTSATAVRTNAWAAVRAGAHVVIGSSGLTAADYAELDELARARDVGVVAAGNFSVMAAVLQHAATIAAQHVEHWEVVDFASAGKADVPSGTARELAETLSAVRRPQEGVSLSETHGPVEARGADVDGTRVHSVRLPGFVVTTEVVFGADGERLVMRHDAGATADPYVAGTLLAVREVAGVRGVRRGLGSFLFDEPS